MGRWGGGKAAGKKNKECSGKAKRGSCGARSGGMVSPCLQQRSADVERGGVGSRECFVSQMGLSTKNVLEILEKRKISLN